MEAMTVAAALALGAASLIAAAPRRAGKAPGREEALAACRLLLEQIANFQQHRGMSSAWLSGDAAFRERLEAKGRQIEALFPALLAMARREAERPHPCLTGNDVELFRHRWRDLREKLPGLAVEQSIAAHSQLVECLLRWLGAFGEARLEPRVAVPGGRELVRNLAQRLPALTECLGQARAIGTSVATRGGCPAVARVRLLFLVSRGEALLDQALGGGHGGLRQEEARRAIREMAEVVRSRMLLPAGVEVGAQAYFALATRAIDAVFAWIEDCGAVAGSVPAGRLQIRPA